MTSTELITVVLSALGGYAVMSFLMKKEAPPSAAVDAESAPPWHEVLGVTENASLAEIEAAHQRLSTLYAPEALTARTPELRALVAQQCEAIERARAEGLAARGASEQDPSAPKKTPT